MEKQEHEESESDPKPVYLDEEHIEKILLLREIAGRLRWWMRLRNGIVGRIPRGRVERREDGAKEKGRRIDCQK